MTISTHGRTLITPTGKRPVRLIAFIIGVLAFALYLPSLWSGFVYDAQIQIASDSYIHTPSHLVDLVTLRALGQDILDRDRPAHLFFLMVDSLLWGRNAFGYHLTSNLLHAFNTGLLFLLLASLLPRDGRPVAISVQCLAAALGAMFFAVHPVLVEPVSEVSDREDSLATFFLLLGLLLADGFPSRRWATTLLRGAGCAIALFLSAASKETGFAGPLLLGLFWLLYHRKDRRAPWIALLVASTIAVGAFAFARFALEPAASKIFTAKPEWLGGSLGATLLIQPRIWAFLFSNVAWPFHLAADYAPQNLAWITLPWALVALAAVLGIQVFLAIRSRLARFGFATFWLGLAPVSNFIPIYQPIGDRFLYLPMVGLAAMLSAALALASTRRMLFANLCAASMATFAFLCVVNVHRQAVFANPLALWTDTVRQSPFSATAQDGLGYALIDAGRYSDALQAFTRAINLRSSFADAWAGGAIALEKMGRYTDADTALDKAVAIDPRYAHPQELLDAVATDRQTAASLEDILTRQQIQGTQSP
ncbi:MAG TPA: tetratricopeptide repeat protein [Chthoniobacterales bacterium]